MSLSEFPSGALYIQGVQAPGMALYACGSVNIYMRSCFAAIRYHCAGNLGSPTLHILASYGEAFALPQYSTVVPVVLSP
jgi:hypothetical protein